MQRMQPGVGMRGAASPAGAAPVVLEEREYVHHHHEHHHPQQQLKADERGLPVDLNRQGPPPSIIALTPTAAPSALGLAGYASSTFIVATWLADWYGDDRSPLYFWPFVLFFGGVGQFLAGMWCFVSRDTLASVVHVTWGSFWISLGLVFNAFALGTLPPVGRWDANPTLGIWMCPLAAVTLLAAFASLARDFVTALTLFLLGSGSVLGAVGFFGGFKGVIYAAAYCWIVSVFTALFRVGSYLLVEALPHRFTPGSRDLLPRYSPRGVRDMFDQGYKIALKEPGVIKGN